MARAKEGAQKKTTAKAEETKPRRCVGDLDIGDTFLMGGVQYKLLSREGEAANAGEWVRDKIAIGVDEDGAVQFGVTEYSRSVVSLSLDTEVE